MIKRTKKMRLKIMTKKLIKTKVFYNHGLKNLKILIKTKAMNLHQ